MEGSVQGRQGTMPSWQYSLAKSASPLVPESRRHLRRRVVPEARSACRRQVSIPAAGEFRVKLESGGSLGWQVGRGTCVAWATLVSKCLVPSQPEPGRRP